MLFLGFFGPLFYIRPATFSFDFTERGSPSFSSSGLLIQTFGQCGLRDEFSFFFFLNASICECSVSFVFICVWLSGLTPTFNSCGKYSQACHCQVSLLLLLCFCLSVCLPAFLSPSPFLLLSYTHTHTHTHTLTHAGTWCTHLRLDIHSLLLLYLTWEP